MYYYVRMRKSHYRHKDQICNPIKPSRLEANVQIGDGWLVWDNVYWYKWCKKNRMPNAPSFSSF